MKVRSNTLVKRSSLVISFERQIWITDGLLKYHRVTSGTTRLYHLHYAIMSIHQFRRKPNKYGKTPFVRIKPWT
ncbi:hypothetical protein Hanom_Chr06g00494691 [Helianthus anomalus]